MNRSGLARLSVWPPANERRTICCPTDTCYSKLSYTQQKQHTASMKLVTLWWELLPHQNLKSHQKNYTARLQIHHTRMYTVTVSITLFRFLLHNSVHSDHTVKEKYHNEEIKGSFHLICCADFNSMWYYSVICSPVSVKFQKWSMCLGGNETAVSDEHNTQHNTYWGCYKKRGSSCTVAHKQALRTQLLP